MHFLLFEIFSYFRTGELRANQNAIVPKGPATPAGKPGGLRPVWRDADPQPEQRDRLLSAPGPDDRALPLHGHSAQRDPSGHDLPGPGVLPRQGRPDGRQFQEG